MDLEIAMFVAIGFFAQIVDGALGMAFGVIASSSLIAIGAAPAIASAAVHAAEIVTTGISGASHVWNKNVDPKAIASASSASAMPPRSSGPLPLSRATMAGLAPAVCSILNTRWLRGPPTEAANERAPQNTVLSIKLRAPPAGG
jgi:hypothetical protein